MSISLVNDWTTPSTGVNNTLSVSPANLGDLMTCVIRYTPPSGTTSDLPNAMSGGGVSLWTLAPGSTGGTGSSGPFGSAWYGTVTATGSSTITVSGGSGNWTASNNRLTAAEFAPGVSGAGWFLLTAGVSAGTSATPTGPTLSPNSGALALVSFSCANAVTAGSTSGYTYVSVSGSTDFAYDPAATGGPAAPSVSQSSGTYLAIGLLFAVCPVPTLGPDGGANADGWYLSGDTIGVPPVAAGQSAIAVLIPDDPTSGDVSAVTGLGFSLWTKVNAVADTDYDLEIWGATGSSGGSSLTVTTTSGGGDGYEIYLTYFVTGSTLTNGGTATGTSSSPALTVSGVTAGQTLLAVLVEDGFYSGDGPGEPTSPSAGVLFEGYGITHYSAGGIGMVCAAPVSSGVVASWSLGSSKPWAVAGVLLS